MNKKWKHFFFHCKEGKSMGNPRYANGNLRRKTRARLKAMGCECGICHGRLGPIHYDEPSDYEHPLSFVVDEKIPVSKWKEYGYPSARAVAEDFSNLQAAHYICNQEKGNRINFVYSEKEKKVIVKDGQW